MINNGKIYKVSKNLRTNIMPYEPIIEQRIDEQTNDWPNLEKKKRR